MLQPNRLPPALHAAFIMSFARARKAGFEQVMTGERGKPVGQGALCPDDLAHGGSEMVIRHPVGYPAEMAKGSHVRIQQRSLITTVIEPYEVITGVHQVHEELPGMPLPP